MKRILVYMLTVILGASIPIYFLLIWEPLKSKETIGDSVDNISVNENAKEKDNLVGEEELFILKPQDNEESLFNYLEGNRKERLNSVLKKLSIVDIVKVNEYFSDRSNEEKVKKGIELVKKRLSTSDYEVFKDIIGNKVNESFL